MATSENILKEFFAKLSLSTECLIKTLEQSNVLLFKSLKLRIK